MTTANAKTIDLTTKEINKSKFSVGALTEYLIYITLICNLLILWGNPTGNNTMVSLGTRVLLISVLLMGAYYFLNSFSHRIDRWRATFAGVFISTVLVVLMNGVGVFVGRYVNIICFLMMPVYMILCRELTHLARIRKVIYITNVLYAVVFIFLYFSDYAYIHYGEYGISTTEDLTLGYRNPNETGIYLLLSFMVMVMAFTYVKHKLLKVGAGALCVVLFWFVQLTNSRICLILSWVFVVAACLKLYRYAGKPIRAVVLLFPFAFFFLMLIIPTLFQQWILLNDTVSSGRDTLFASAWNSLNFVSFFRGNLSKYAGSNLHNSYLSIFIQYGLLVFVFYFSLLRQTLSHCARWVCTHQTGIAYLAIMVVILHGLAEGTLLISGGVYAGLAGLLFVLVREDDEEEQDEDEEEFAT